MGKALIIAEKPSVAGDIARALGGFKRHEEYYESDQYVLSSAVGHLLELAVPEQYEVKRGKWTFAHLPIIPPHFDLQPIERTTGKLKVLAKLVRRKDVTSVINACDAGREGELIFRNLVKYLNVEKPMLRLWLQSMTPAAIRDGFAHQREDAALRPLADAATCRSEADWLVGINGTRAMTAFNSKTGGFHLTTVGRVQTPTLAIVVEREERIKAFVPRGYFEVHGTFAAAAGEYPGRWFDESFAREKNGDSELKPERIWNREKADSLRDRCLGKPGIVTEESKPSTQLSPLLYDLTSLQREANNRFGFSAHRTLQLAQALYERHKAITYPRTDSRALPEDYVASARQALEALKEVPYGVFAQEILRQDWLKPNKRIFNNAKVSDHFAIIPTPDPPKHLHADEDKLYDMITRRFLAVFFPAAEFLLTTRITRVEGEPFKTEGKVLTQPGWLSVYGREAAGVESPNLVPVQTGETVSTTAVEVVANQTKPPARFTEATLLGAMEGAGKLVEDEELRAAMSEKGLGTPATRAAIIEGLLHEKYLLRAGKELQPTAKAFSLMALLRGLGIPELTAPELTGNWEFKLKQIERGQLARAAFMREIAAMTEAIVRKAKEHEHDTIPGEFGTLQTPCPKCGGEIRETYKKFQCANTQCDFALWKIVAGRQFEIHEIETLIRSQRVGPLTGFRSKAGRPFSAAILLTNEFKAEFDFERNGGEGGEAEKNDTPVHPDPLGNCPKCNHRVFETGKSYLCEQAAGGKNACDFRCGRIILQQPLERPQMTKLLATRKTDLLDKFISKRGRPFKAFLVLDADGKVGFEFEARRPRAGGSRAKEKTPSEPAPKLDFTGLQPVATCPRCGGRVFAAEKDYLCEKSQSDTKPCKFRVGRSILQRALSAEELGKLIQDGRSDLLSNFISKRGRPFTAWLVLDDRGKVGFEFPDRDDAPDPKA
ncbi:MAG: DNA topoisomerase III [Verrucomicrobia bacterium]|nr:DNA topoisomerase III [Verrucomicrobiota bacterium]